MDAGHYDWSPRSGRLRIGETCQAFQSGQLDPRNREHVLAQLGAEAERRITSWLFERLALATLHEVVAADEISSGWFVGGVKPDESPPRIWFRLAEGRRGPNRCDNALARKLVSHGATVIDVRWRVENPGRLVARVVGRDKAFRPLEHVLGELDGAVDLGLFGREPDGDVERWRLASLAMIHERLTDDELTALSLSRVFFNVYLERWFRGKAADIDAVVLVGDEPAIVELKRKYPTANGWLGLDRIAAEVMDWFTYIAGGRYINLVLISPVWNAKVHALHLLDEDSITAASARWLAQDVTAYSIVDTLETRGEQSGMYHNNRLQWALEVEEFTVVGSGLAPKAIRDFLDHRDGLPRASMTELKATRDQATRDYWRFG